ncbi:MAG: tetratricopeptide repeat protein [Candidatus Omnitrophota bacterium]|jgi:tetratricopeptide (TPR) repeat protein
MAEFSELRKRIDEAITYGCFELAARLTQQGLRQAREQGLLGEIEYFAGQSEILRGNYYEAIEHFDRAIKYNPYDGAAFNDRALCMVELDIINEAFYYFDKGIEVEPNYATVHHNKGWLFNKIGRHREAIECFKRALEIEPERAVTYENLANALANLSDYQGALDCYEKAISLLKADYSDIKKQITAQMKLVEAKITRR